MNTPALTSALIMAGLGLILAIDGLVPAPPRPGAPLSPAQRWARLTHRPTGAAGRRRDLRWGLAVLVGVVLFVLTGWVAALALGPIIVLLAPTLLGAAPPTDIPLMEALDRWVRQVAAVLPQGRDIITAVRISRPRAPELIAGSVDQLVSRLDGRMEPREAFQRMADELDSSEADAVLASLALAATHPRGASVTLKAIAGTIQQRLKCCGRWRLNGPSRATQCARSRWSRSPCSGYCWLLGARSWPHWQPLPVRFWSPRRWSCMSPH